MSAEQFISFVKKKEKPFHECVVESIKLLKLSGFIKGFSEAKLRWSHPSKEVVFPNITTSEVLEEHILKLSRKNKKR